MKLTRREADVSPEMLDRGLTDLQADRPEIGARPIRTTELTEPLGDLLDVAERVRAELAPAEPDRAFVQASRSRVLDRARVAARGRRPVLRPGPPIWRPAYALAILLLLGLLMGGAGVVQASAGALPGDALYDVKRAVEETQLVLTWSAPGDAGLMERFAEERLAEASAMAAAGRSDAVETALAGYDEMIDRLTVLAEESGIKEGPGSADQLQADLERHIEVLEGVRSHSPAVSREHIDKAIEHSRHNQAVMEQLESGGNPSDLAPGQQRTPKQDGGKPGETQSEDVGPTSKPRDKTGTPGPPQSRPKPTKKNAP